MLLPPSVEARELISNCIGLVWSVWIYESEGEVASICVATRNTQNVSAITKVYTTRKWRCRRFAEHLVRYVTRRLVINRRRFLFDTNLHPRFTSLSFECGKRNVTLYVGHNNSAQSVCDRVGFVGLCGKERVNGVEGWS